jgi:hypothetical protein
MNDVAELREFVAVHARRIPRAVYGHTLGRGARDAGTDRDTNADMNADANATDMGTAGRAGTLREGRSR